MSNEYADIMEQVAQGIFDTIGKTTRKLSKAKGKGQDGGVAWSKKGHREATGVASETAMKQILTNLNPWAAKFEGRTPTDAEIRKEAERAGQREVNPSAIRAWWKQQKDSGVKRTADFMRAETQRGETAAWYGTLREDKRREVDVPLPPSESGREPGDLGPRPKPKPKRKLGDPTRTGTFKERMDQLRREDEERRRREEELKRIEEEVGFPVQDIEEYFREEEEPEFHWHEGEPPRRREESIETIPEAPPRTQAEQEYLDLMLTDWPVPGTAPPEEPTVDIYPFYEHPGNAAATAASRRVAAPLQEQSFHAGPGVKTPVGDLPKGPLEHLIHKREWGEEVPPPSLEAFMGQQPGALPQSITLQDFLSAVMNRKEQETGIIDDKDPTDRADVTIKVTIFNPQPKRKTIEKTVSLATLQNIKPYISSIYAKNYRTTPSYISDPVVSEQGYSMIMKFLGLPTSIQAVRIDSVWGSSGDSFFTAD